MRLVTVDPLEDVVRTANLLKTTYRAILGCSQLVLHSQRRQKKGIAYGDGEKVHLSSQIQTLAFK